MEIIERITETLEKTDKKATDLCDRLGIRTSTMSTWKTRNSDPPAKYIKPIADFLGVTSEFLLNGKERLLPASSPLQKRTNFSNCTGHCHRTNNLSLSGNSRDF